MNASLESLLGREQNGSASTASADTTTADLERNFTENHPVYSVILLCFYVIIFTVGLIGNSMVLYVVIKHKAMRTTTNIFIACLSVSDLAICIFAVPFTPLAALLASWPLGLVMCKMVPYILALCVFVSTMIFVAIAIDRFLIIVHPHFPRMTSLQQKLIIAGLFLLSVSASLPVGVFMRTNVKRNGQIECKEFWPSNEASRIYTFMVLLLQLILPTLLVAACYIAIALKLRKQSKLLHKNSGNDKVKANAQRNSKINRMLVAMVVIFIGCWLPLDLYHFVVPLIPEGYEMHVFMVVHVIAMSSIMYNPFLYGWMNENFNRHFRHIVPCLDYKKCRDGRESQDMTRITTFRAELSSYALHEQQGSILLTPDMNGDHSRNHAKQQSNQSEAGEPLLVLE